MNDETSTARDVMDPHPSLLQATDKITDGVRIIMEHRYRNLPVVDDAGRFLGVFGVNCLIRTVLPKAVLVKDGLKTVPFVRETLRDLRQRLADVENEPVTYCLSEDIPVVHPDTALVETLLVLYRNRISIPVVEKDSGLLVGMISYFDVGERILAQEL